MSFKFSKLFALLLIIAPINILAQNIIVSGNVSDKNTGEYMPGTNIYILNKNIGSMSDNNGFFSIRCSKNDTLIFSFIGYKMDSLPVKESGFYAVKLYTQEIKISEIVVKALQNEDDFMRAKLNVSFAKLKTLPSIGGIKDPIHLFQTLPGIAPAKEGMSAMTVRGGNTDQNLYVLEGATLYNTGHLLNFISVFNPLLVKKIDFYKDAFPARYGGRLSSVMDISLKDGNSKKIQHYFDLGIINSNLFINGPFRKDSSTTFLLALRSTYVDIFNFRKALDIKLRDLNALLPYQFGDANKKTFNGYTFADANAKITHFFDIRNKISLSFYHGIDYSRYFAAPYGNTDKLLSYYTLTNELLALKSVHQISNSLGLQFNAYYTVNKSKTKDYYELYSQDISNFNFQNSPQYYKAEDTKTKEKSSLNDLSLNAIGTYTSNYHTLQAGFNYIYHSYLLFDYERESKYAKLPDEHITFKSPQMKAHEAAFFISENFRYKLLNIMAGYRLSAFRYNTTNYLRHEPRFSLGIKAGEKTFFRLSYAQNYQYNHSLIRNNPMIDRISWVPSTENILPQKAIQYSFSYMQKFQNLNFTFSAYYKDMYNLSYYQYFNTDTFYYTNWRTHLLSGGTGNSKGFEFQIEKTKGRFTGNLNYTLSWTNRQFEQLNRAQEFPFIYDRRHILNLFVTYRYNKHWNFGGFFTASNGRRINFPNGMVSRNPLVSNNFFVYQTLNSFHLPFYHRLDLNAQWQKLLKNNRKFSIDFDLYNAYFHKNAYTIFIDRMPIPNEKGDIVGYKTRVLTKSFLPVIPSLSFKYEF